MDQERTLEYLDQITEPGGGIVILDDDQWFTRGRHEWQDEVYDIADRYVDDLSERTGAISDPTTVRSTGCRRWRAGMTRGHVASPTRTSRI